MIRAAISGLLAGALFCAPVSPLWTQAQAQAQETPQSPVATPIPFRLLDQERLLRDSGIGQETMARIRAAQQELEAENQQIFEQLSAEEQALTELRPTLSATEFRDRADAFDARVEEIRAERARLLQELEQSNQRLLSAFYDAALPVLQQVMEENGVLGLLRSDMMVLSADVLDITPEVVARLNATFQGGELSPEPENDPTEPAPPTD